MTIDADTAHGWEIAGRNLTVERLNAEIKRLKTERDTYQRASTYWWRHYCEAVGREAHTTVAADAQFVREFDALVSVAKRLAEFDQNFPKGRVYSAHDCPPERELDSIIADAKSVLSPLH